MLVEINLLPNNEPKKRSFHLVLIGIIILLFAVAGFYFYQIHSIKQDIDSVDTQITMTKKVIEKAQKQTTGDQVEQSASVTQLKTAVEWANTYPIETTSVVEHLTKLLPQRGFIETFNYSESGVISLSAQFDTATDAAYFLDNLLTSKWIEDATLTSVNTKERTEEDESGSETATNNSASANSIAVNDYLPRYLGQYEIHFDKEEIKKSKDNGSDEEGVEGS